MVAEYLLSSRIYIYIRAHFLCCELCYRLNFLLPLVEAGGFGGSDDESALSVRRNDAVRSAARG